MTGRLAEVRQELAGVAACLDEAYGQAVAARACLGEALALLAELGREHSEPLPPPQLTEAAGELDRGLGLIANGVAAVAGLDGRL